MKADHPKIGAVFGVHEEKTLEQLRDVAAHAEKVALMADGHLGYVMPIGGVAAYKNQVSVVGVGFDIACGNCAIKTDLLAEQFERPDLTRFADEIAAEISFGVGRKNRSDDAPVDHPLFEDPAWGGIPAHHRGNLREKARTQLGTVGSGNETQAYAARRTGGLSGSSATRQRSCVPGTGRRSSRLEASRPPYRSWPDSLQSSGAVDPLILSGPRAEGDGRGVSPPSISDPKTTSETSGRPR